MGVITELRAETRTIHNQLETLPYVQELLAGSLALETYIGFLRATHIILATLEPTLSQSSHPAVQAVWRPDMSKLPLLERDLTYFSAPRNVVDHATLNAELLAQQIRMASLHEHISLLGFLYVFEGATLGGLVQRSALAKCFAVDDQGLAYVNAYGSATKSRFMQFSRRMNAAVQDQADKQRVISGAKQAFTGIARVLQALQPLITPAGPLVTSLNPEAGTHAIATDLREIEAALRAGEVSWNRFPYYAARYGERGLRYTRSDSAWLAALGRFGSQQAHKHIFWLGEVLAARGMPRWLLEQHLAVLYNALITAIPERRADYEVLLAVSQSLQAERQAAIAEARFRSLTAAFDSRVGNTLSTPLPDAGALLVAAVADERAGIARAVESVESWFTDPQRFPKPWIKAVRATIAAARKG